MGWRLIKGWETPWDIIPPQTLPLVYNGELRDDNVHLFFIRGEYYGNIDSHPITESSMIGFPEWFEFSEDYTENWVKVEECTTKYGWVRTKSGATEIGRRRFNIGWYLIHSKHLLINDSIECIMPIDIPIKPIPVPEI